MTSESTGGYSLVETIIYAALLVGVSFAVIAGIVTTEHYLRETKEYDDLRRSGLNSLERIVRSIRDANSIDEAGSVLGTNPGKLRIAVTNAGGGTDFFEIATSSSKIGIKKDGGAEEILTGEKILVPNLVFRKITTAKSSAVRIEMTLSTLGLGAHSENFATTVVLRGSY